MDCQFDGQLSMVHTFTTDAAGKRGQATTTQASDYGRFEARIDIQLENKGNETINKSDDGHTPIWKEISNTEETELIHASRGVMCQIFR